jgi:hypothetical protein
MTGARLREQNRRSPNEFQLNDGQATAGVESGGKASLLLSGIAIVLISGVLPGRRWVKIRTMIDIRPISTGLGEG